MQCDSPLPPSLLNATLPRPPLNYVSTGELSSELRSKACTCLYSASITKPLGTFLVTSRSSTTTGTGRRTNGTRRKHSVTGHYNSRKESSWCATSRAWGTCGLTPRFTRAMKRLIMAREIVSRRESIGLYRCVCGGGDECLLGDSSSGLRQAMWTDVLVQSHKCNPICKHLNLKPTSNRAKVPALAYFLAFYTT
jgi:hypothetical protein